MIYISCPVFSGRLWKSAVLVIFDAGSFVCVLLLFLCCETEVSELSVGLGSWEKVKPSPTEKYSSTELIANDHLYNAAAGILKRWLKRCVNTLPAWYLGKFDDGSQ